MSGGFVLHNLYKVLYNYMYIDYITNHLCLYYIKIYKAIRDSVYINKKRVINLKLK